MRVLLTGGAGFVGGRMLERLRNVGAEVVHLGRKSVDKGGVQDWVFDDVNALSSDDVPGGGSFDRVFHFAAAGVNPSDRNFSNLTTGNILFGLKLLQIVDAKSFVFAGSSAEYAANHCETFSEADPLQTVDPYGASKAAGGLLQLACAHQLMKSLAYLRFFHVYGPGEKSHRLTSSLYASLRAGSHVALSSGAQFRDFVFIDDAIAAFEIAGEALMESRLSTGAYNVSTGEGVSVREACTLMASLMDADHDLLGFGDLPMRQNELPRVVGNNSAFRAATGWAPTYSLADGLKCLIAEQLNKIEPKR